MQAPSERSLFRLSIPGVRLPSPENCNVVQIPGSSDSGHEHPMHACILSHFSRVQLFVTLWTTACQTPLSMGFSRQEYQGELPCSPPGDLSDPRIELASLTYPVFVGQVLFHKCHLGSPCIPDGIYIPINNQCPQSNQSVYSLLDKATFSVVPLKGILSFISGSLGSGAPLCTIVREGQTCALCHQSCLVLFLFTQ